MRTSPKSAACPPSPAAWKLVPVSTEVFTNTSTTSSGAATSTFPFNTSSSDTRSTTLPASSALSASSLGRSCRFELLLFPVPNSLFPGACAHPGARQPAVHLGLSPTEHLDVSGLLPHLTSPHFCSPRKPLLCAACDILVDDDSLEEHKVRLVTGLILKPFFRIMSFQKQRRLGVRGSGLLQR